MYYRQVNAPLLAAGPAQVSIAAIASQAFSVDRSCCSKLRFVSCLETKKTLPIGGNQRAARLPDYRRFE